MNYFELKKIYEEKFFKANIEETADIDWIIVEITGKQRSMLPFMGDFSKDELEKITQALEKRLKHILVLKFYIKMNSQITLHFFSLLH